MSRAVGCAGHPAYMKYERTLPTYGYMYVRVRGRCRTGRFYGERLLLAKQLLEFKRTELG